jgi:hypothetical protein
MEWAFFPYDRVFSAAVSMSAAHYNRSPSRRDDGRAKPRAPLCRGWGDAIARWARKGSGDDDGDLNHAKAKLIGRKIGLGGADGRKSGMDGKMRRRWQWRAAGQK